MLGDFWKQESAKTIQGDDISRLFYLKLPSLPVKILGL